MQAHFKISLPFDILVVTGTPYERYVSSRGGFFIIHDLPSLSDERRRRGGFGGYTLDGRPAIQSDTLNIRFFAEQFDRSSTGQHDPPDDIVNAELASFLERLRFMTLAPQIHSVRLDQCSWNVEYRTDDDTKLTREDDEISGRGGVKRQFSFIGVRPSVWDATFSLPDDFESPVWHSLMIDAQGALPHVGSAIALSCTALEVFIPNMLDQFANRHHLVHPELWNWIWNRSIQKKPSLDEQFDGLLSVVSGHSLKESNDLWGALQNLIEARNNFVHQGEAALGGRKRKVVTLEKAQELVGDAYRILLKVRDWLPETLRWPILTETFQLQISIPIRQATADEAGAAPAGADDQ